MEGSSPRVVCIGEVLWDVYPDGRRLGGAPFNVAGHLRALGVDAAMVSALGRDTLGEEIRDAAMRLGMPSDLIQTHPTLPTGTVRVESDSLDSPRYTVETPAAWDGIVATPRALSATAAAAYVVYGSLAQRREPSRSSVRRLLATRATKVFDVNLRPPHDQRETVEHLLHLSNLVKLNDEELARLSAWFGARGSREHVCRWLSTRFGLDLVCVTLGAGGAQTLHCGEWYECAGIPITVVDAVGAGDAFLAGLLSRMLAGADMPAALAWANALGAFVASKPGALPHLDMDRIASLASRRST